MENPCLTCSDGWKDCKTCKDFNTCNFVKPNGCYFCKCQELEDYEYQQHKE